LSRCKFKFFDNEKDKCSITNTEEIQEAINLFFGLQSTLKIEISFVEHKEKLNKDTKIARVHWRDCKSAKINLHDEGISLMNGKEFEKAKQIFLQQLETMKCRWRRSVPLYNIACCEALLGNIDSSLMFLSQAIENGYRNVEHMEKDEDLISLHELDAFKILVSEIKNANNNVSMRPKWKKHIVERKYSFDTSNKNNHSKEEKKIDHENQSPNPFKTSNKDQIEVAVVEEKKIDQNKPIEPLVELQPINIPVQEIETNKNANDENINNNIPLQEIETNKNANDENINNNKVEDNMSAFSSLQAMGFVDEIKILQALKLAKGDIVDAIQILLSQD